LLGLGGSEIRPHTSLPEDSYIVEDRDGFRLLSLVSSDGMNRLTRARVLALTDLIRRLSLDVQPLIISGGPIFSVGADLNEISKLIGPEAVPFARMGQELMSAIADFPAPVYAAIDGYCMGGGLDLALACHRRIASPHAVFGHRGAALGLMTGWGGTQRLPRLVGKAKALEMLVAAEKIHAKEALRMGLVDELAAYPVEFAAVNVQAVVTRKREAGPSLRSE
jgi:enoyl-CoA hydratase/carnithine racemase